MKLVPRVALLLERHEADALALLQCWTNAWRRMDENRRGELAGPAEDQERAEDPDGVKGD